MTALDACTLQLSHTAAALRQARETEHDTEQEVNPLLCSTVTCLIIIVLSISKMQQLLQTWSCLACFIKRRYQQVRRLAARAASCSRPAFDWRAGAGWRARCSRRRHGVLPPSCRLSIFLDLVESNRVTRSQAALKHPAVVPAPPSLTVCNRLSA